MVEKGIRREIRHAIHQYVKTNNKYSKNYKKIIDNRWAIDGQCRKSDFSVILLG